MSDLIVMANMATTATTSPASTGDVQEVPVAAQTIATVAAAEAARVHDLQVRQVLQALLVLPLMRLESDASAVGQTKNADVSARSRLRRRCFFLTWRDIAGEADDRFSDDRYSDRGPYSPAPAGQHQYTSNRDNQQQDYPGGHYFPPPPTNDYHDNSRDLPASGAPGNTFAPYNPADYANQAPVQPIYGSGAYGESTGNLNAPRGENNYGAGSYDNSQQPRDDRRAMGREPPENVSSPDDFTRSHRDHDDRDHHRQRRHRSDESSQESGMS
jgi:hypothetical protein